MRAGITSRRENVNFIVDFPLWISQAKSKPYLVIENSIHFLLLDFKPEPAMRLSPKGGRRSLSPLGVFSAKWLAWCYGWGCPADLINAFLLKSVGLEAIFHTQYGDKLS